MVHQIYKINTVNFLLILGIHLSFLIINSELRSGSLVGWFLFKPCHGWRARGGDYLILCTVEILPSKFLRQRNKWECLAPLQAGSYNNGSGNLRWKMIRTKIRGLIYREHLNLHQPPVLSLFPSWIMVLREVSGWKWLCFSRVEMI